MIDFEKQNKILERMLENTSDEYDKTEGGLFYDIHKPVSIELEKVNENMALMFKNGFAETAKGVYLDYITKEVGVIRKPPTKARGFVKIKGTAGTVIKTGTKVASDTYIFLTTEEKTIPVSQEINVPIESEEYGSRYNLPKHTVINFPVTISGLNNVDNTTELVDGYDGESDNSLRERYFFKVQEPVTSGNKHHYKKWALEVEGVGNVKVFPLWKGAGTVKVVIVDDDVNVAPSELINRAYNYIESVRPIGATLTVASATNRGITIAGKLKISQNVDFEEVKKTFKKNVVDYFKKVGFKQNYVSYAQIGNIVLNLEGVIDYDNLKINNGYINVKLQEEEIPKLLNISLTKEVV